MMVGFLEVEDIEQAYRRCRKYTAKHAKSFYFASQVLPREKRDAAYAVYAFCRYADNIVDVETGAQETLRAQKRLDALRDQLRYVYSHAPQMDPKLLAFRDAVMRYNIPQQHFLDLLRGVEMDLALHGYATFDELREYCYCVASVVGLMMTHIFGISNPGAEAHAVDLGLAMQLTNILRDVGEDHRLGRCYLPAEEMERFRYTMKDVERGVVNDNFRELMRFQIARARQYYTSSDKGISMLTGDGSRFCVRLMTGTYRRILDAIEKNGFDVYSTRAYVSLPGKLLVAVTSAFADFAPSGARPAKQAPGDLVNPHPLPSSPLVSQQEHP